MDAFFKAMKAKFQKGGEMKGKGSSKGPGKDRAEQFIEKISKPPFPVKKKDDKDKKKMSPEEKKEMMKKIGKKIGGKGKAKGAATGATPPKMYGGDMKKKKMHGGSMKKMKKTYGGSMKRKY